MISVDVPNLAPFATRKSDRHAKSLANSKTFNRCNIESRWYSVFAHALMRLLDIDILDDRSGYEHALIIQPQCDVSVARAIWTQHSLTKLVTSSFFDSVNGVQSINSDDEDDDPSSDYDPTEDEAGEIIFPPFTGEPMTLRPFELPPSPNLEDKEDEGWGAYIAAHEREQTNEQDAGTLITR
ncbi:hypothetical protein HGRIS_014784 [Hohenbuehelia grisea]|uniref:Uncharacterized protein n=1 Tax=Hohenbuehelia grisea TaxID=104357 RepID=A0ABR3IQS9_9AGAR